MKVEEKKIKNFTTSPTKVKQKIKKFFTLWFHTNPTNASFESLTQCQFQSCA